MSLRSVSLPTVGNPQAAPKKEPGARAMCVRDARPDPFVIRPHPL
jgi:hypothetical protein